MLLVTGGLGFIGAHTARAALEAHGGCVVTTRTSRALPAALADASSPAHGNEQESRVASPRLGSIVDTLDIRDTEALIELGRRHGVTGIIHLAAAGIELPALEQIEQNMHGFLSAIAAASALGIDRVTFASSIGVYGVVPDTATTLSEDQPLPPEGLHGIQASKKMLEIAGDLASRSGGPDVVAVRVPAVWGPGGSPRSPFFSLPQLVHAAVNGDELPEVDGGSGLESVYVRDAGRALVAVQASEGLEHRLYNLGSGAPTNAEVIEAIRDVTSDAAVADVAAPRAAVRDAAPTTAHTDRPSVFGLDTSRIRADTDWTPVYSLQSGIADYVSWLRAGHER
jgi:UDP-glucose 4-epimerase